MRKRAHPWLLLPVTVPGVRRNLPQVAATWSYECTTLLRSPSPARVAFLPYVLDIFQPVPPFASTHRESSCVGICLG